MIFGGVPISVMRPPRMQPKDSGISRIATDCLNFAPVVMATGINNPRVPTLFMKADRTAPTPASEAIWLVGVAEQARYPWRSGRHRRSRNRVWLGSAETYGVHHSVTTALDVRQELARLTKMAWGT